MREPWFSPVQDADRLHGASVRGSSPDYPMPALLATSPAEIGQSLGVLG